jgi:hypothetical protein
VPANPTINPIGSQPRATPMTISGTAEPGSHIMVDTDWGHQHGAGVGPDGRWGASFVSPTDPGTHNVTVTHRSEDGSEVTSSASFTIRK